MGELRVANGRNAISTEFNATTFTPHKPLWLLISSAGSSAPRKRFLEDRPISRESQLCLDAPRRTIKPSFHGQYLPRPRPACCKRLRHVRQHERHRRHRRDVRPRILRLLRPADHHDLVRPLAPRNRVANKRSMRRTPLSQALD
jgi:hypothetical protein